VLAARTIDRKNDLMQSLFGELRLPPTAAFTEAASGPFAAVALEQSIDQLLDYAIPLKLVHQVRIGQRVRVPLGRGNRLARGYVVAISPVTDYPKIKSLVGIEDERVLFPPKIMELARWMSRYYVAPLGTVLESVIPSAVKKKVGIGYSQIVRPARPPQELQSILETTRAPKRRAIIARLLQMEPGGSIDIVRLAGEAGVTVPTVRKLARFGLITITPEIDLPRLTADLKPSAGDEPDIAFNEDQQAVFDTLRPRMGGRFSVNLLHGVTGSGKTEVYLQCIREVVSAGKQAIVLVPEIALTPQTVRRFIARFKRVAILHSGLTATERHRFWQQISNGMADVVVGARSAVFAPVPNLGVIVVDEEHESSYKQDTAPRYHARDVAIKRGQIEQVPVVLGSATPSLESYAKVQNSPSPSGRGQGEGEPGTARTDARPHPNPLPEGEGVKGATVSPQLLSLPNRVRGLAMAHIEVVDMKIDNRFRRGVHLISQRLEHMLRVTIEAGHQAILLLNRRGYSNFVYCPSCTNVIQCNYCDTTMTYHRAASVHAHSATSAEGVHTGQLHCHYCLAVNPLPEKCPTCQKKLSLFGLGTQRVEEELGRKFPDLKFARVDSDTMRSAKDYEALLGRFARGEVPVMLGTQMIAKGLDYPNVTLVGVISGDTALSLPDFRAAERTFQLITQVAGRAGRGDAPGRVILQTFMPDDPTIKAAIRQDFAGFARTELAHRREVGLPPFARMVRIILRDQDQEKLHKHSEQLAAKLAAEMTRENGAVRLKGPMPCPISRIAGYFRNQIVMLAATPAPLQRVLAAVREKGGLARSERIAVDVDPVALL
jgi:primosomal protein N' (replication factor Y)